MTNTYTPKKPTNVIAKQTTIASVIALLKRPKDETLEELGEATNWQPHSIRAALAGLGASGSRL